MLQTLLLLRFEVMDKTTPALNEYFAPISTPARYIGDYILNL